jgi:nitrite reductase/ring-hydroxylating ferredoxin subunit
VDVLVTRATSGEVCAISNTCNHLGGPLSDGAREGDTVICPWHGSRFELCGGASKDGPAIFPQSHYEVRVRDGNIEARAAKDNIQEKVR